MLSDLESIHKKPVDHLMDSIVLGKIVKIRDQILMAQKEGKPVFRFESGDPNFSVSPDVLETLLRVAQEAKTHYPPSTGIAELRKVIMLKLEQKNKIIKLVFLQTDIRTFICSAFLLSINIFSFYL